MADVGGGRVGEWLPDPTGRFQSRYWDGEWTEHVVQHGVRGTDPLPSSPGNLGGAYEQPPERSVGERLDQRRADTRKVAGIVVYVGAGLLCLGAFLPWVKLTAPFLGTVTKDGIEGDGQITLVLGLLVGLLAWLSLSGKAPAARWVVVGLAAVALAIVLYDAVDASQRFADIREETDMAVGTSLGVGLYVSGLGALAVVGGMIAVLKTGR